MGVIVQEMVDPIASGVVFSRDPMTGLSEVVIEAVAGRGDALVGEGTTPQRWRFRWGDCIDSPASPILDPNVLVDIVSATEDIEKQFGTPVDLEWVWDGEAVHWVQLRAVTGLEAIDVYSNRIAREVLPGIIKPLVWSVNVPLVNGAWIDLFTQFIGPNELRPDDLARSFGYRAYFNMGTIGRIFEMLGMPRETLELLLGFEGTRRPTFRPTVRTLRHLPRMVLAGMRVLLYGRRIGDLLSRLDAELRVVEGVDVEALSDREILADLDGLAGIVRRAAYANIVIPLLMSAYYGGLRRRLERRGIDVARLDLDDAAAVDSGVDPAPRLDSLHGRFSALDEAAQERVRREGYRALDDVDPSFRVAIDRFLARFGHFSDSGNDFSAVPWREDRERVLRMVVDHRPASADDSRLRWAEVAAGENVFSRLVLERWRRRARDYQRHRDEVGFHYTRGYGLFRSRYLELGRRLVARHLLDHSEEVWYLTDGEIRQAIGGHPVPCRTLAARRRAEVDAAGDFEMPELIFGDDFVPSPVDRTIGGVLHGIPTSRGVYRGPIRVVRGRDDFARLESGDVLVIPFSDVGWTPLFARAGAVVAESGGILSHSSIVAREYGIPCVVSVPGACRLPEGTIAIVDGYAGAVTVEEANPQ
jgi:pyruvate,water dikinase